MKQYLVLDIGGSAIKYAVIDEQLNFLEKGKVPVPLDNIENFVETIGQLYDQFSNDIQGMAISMPGIIDPDAGFAYTGGALRYIKNMNIVECLQKRCPLPITIGNDAKCAANAEVGFGSLKDVQDGAIVILGTGIGGCLIKDHQVHIGKHYSAGEFSSIKTDYHDPYALTTTWARRTGIAGLLLHVQEHLHTDQYFTGIEIFDMANQGHQGVIEAIDEFAQEIAIQLWNIHTIFDCEKIAIGGGISAQPLLLELIQKHVDDLFDHIEYDAPRFELVVCQYRNDANLIGALYQHMQTY